MPKGRPSGRTGKLRKSKDIDARNVSGRKKSVKGKKAATGLNEDIIEEFRRLMSKVFYLDTAAAFLGVKSCTVKRWIDTGRKEYDRWKDDPMREVDKDVDLYLRFFLAYRTGLAEAERRNLGNLDKAGKRYWQASAWILERRFPDKWGGNGKELRALRKQVYALQRLLLQSGISIDDDIDVLLDGGGGDGQDRQAGGADTTGKPRLEDRSRRNAAQSDQSERLRPESM